MSEYVRQELLDEWIVAHDKYKARAERAERKVARVGALRDLWEGRGDLLAHAAGRLTAALTDEETTDE